MNQNNKNKTNNFEIRSFQFFLHYNEIFLVLIAIYSIKINCDINGKVLYKVWK
jgi:hypothetical protein